MSLAARSSTLIRSGVTRTVAQRQMATQPKLHKAKDAWAELKATRPPKDHMDEHLVFHPPYNGPAMGVALFVAFTVGYGTMAFGLAHQQYKQGFWK